MVKKIIKCSLKKEECKMLNNSSLKNLIDKNKRSREELYKRDAENMESVLNNLKAGNFKSAKNSFWGMDTIVRDHFLEALTKNHKDKEALKFASNKLGVEWNLDAIR